ncbi:MAG: formylglycine-generating enzyme family protein [Desulfobacterales bacterium]|nr:formylglycine-generating enzyme family protein [Desulfobacterales bacterium]
MEHVHQKKCIQLKNFNDKRSVTNMCNYALLFVWLCCLSCSGGSSSSEPTGSLKVEVNWSDIDYYQCTQMGITTVVLEIFHYETSLFSSTYLLQPCQTTTITLDKVKIGSNLTLVINAKDSEKKIIYQGRAYGIRIDELIVNDGGTVHILPYDIPTMNFVSIPPGTVMMGSPETEIGRAEDEKQHLASLSKGFELQTTEVTQAQWESVMGFNTSAYYVCQNCPVENVSWYEVQEFIKQLNKNDTKHVYRLPTEAEWEYAARAGTQTAFANGEIVDENCNDPVLNEIGWFCGNALLESKPVAQKKPNAFGLYDMHGNVLEWCQDSYGEYPDGFEADPVGSTTGGEYKVVRGGHRLSPASHCRSAKRFNYKPDTKNLFLGFRLVRT